MIYELRLFDGRVTGGKPNKVVKFTWWSCQGNCIGHADRLSFQGNGGSGGFRSMQLLERHFHGPEVNRNYGYGRGYEPIIVGSV